MARADRFAIVARKLPDPPRDSTAEEVDRLLRKLPGADPTLRGDEPRQPRGPRPVAPGTVMGAVARQPAPPSAPRAWGLAVGAAVLGAALTQWPYAHACGFGLTGYLAAVALVLGLGIWGAGAAWRARAAAAHVIALLAVMWGLGLAAERILPRTGYAADTATWTCPG